VERASTTVGISKTLDKCQSFRHQGALGDSAPAAPVFGHWLSDEDLHKVALADLLDCWYLHRTDAAAEITQMLADYPAAPGALLTIGDTMAACGLLDDACSTWLRIYGKEDVPLWQLLTVTNRLRRCGRAGKEWRARITATPRGARCVGGQRGAGSVRPTRTRTATPAAHAGSPTTMNPDERPEA
jgi:hypothetical protein